MNTCRFLGITDWDLPTAEAVVLADHSAALSGFSSSVSTAVRSTSASVADNSRNQPLLRASAGGSDGRTATVRAWGGSGRPW